MKLKKITALLLVSAMTVASMAGCSSKGANTTTSSEANEIGAMSDPTHLNVVMTFNVSMATVTESYSACWAPMRHGVSEALTKVANDGKIVPWLAKDWSSSENYTKWVIGIRDDVYFSNGTQMTPTKVAASLNYVYDFNDPAKGGPDALTNFMVRPKEIVADDNAGTVTLTFEKPIANVPGALSNPAFAIMDWEASKDIDFANKGEIGTGPYVYDKCIEGHSIELVKNEYYYDDVPFETVTILGMEDSSTASYALQDGSADVGFNLSAADLTLLKEKGFASQVASGARTGFYFINHNGILGNDDLRKAAIMAVDWATIDKVTVGGSYIYGYAPISESYVEYGGDVNNPLAYNPEAAKELLDKAGIKDTDGDGIRELDGKNIELRLVTNKARQMDVMADAAVPMLKEVGIGATHSLTDDQIKVGESGDYDLINWNQITVQCGDGVNFLRQFVSDSTSNYGNYNNTEYDSIFAKLSEEFDNDKRNDLVSQLQKILIDDGAAMIAGYYQFNACSAPYIEGAAANGAADYYWLTNAIRPAK